MIDADTVAREAGMGNRINTVMQPCFFQLSGVLPPDEAIAQIKASVEHAYGRRGRAVVERNFAAIDAALHALVHVEIPARAWPRPPPRRHSTARTARSRWTAFPPTHPTSCSRSPRCCSPATATCCR